MLISKRRAVPALFGAAAIFTWLLAGCSDTSLLPTQRSAAQLEAEPVASGIVFLERPALEKPSKSVSVSASTNSGIRGWIYVSKTVTPEEGGVLTAGNALIGTTTFDVPARAVTERVQISLRVHIMGRVMVDLEFQPSGLQFSEGAIPILTLSYSGAQYGRKLSGLTLFEQDEKTGRWTEVPGAVWDPLAKTVSAPIWHFSRYAIGSD